MESFVSELQIPFPFRLENGHVICKEQLLVGILPAGPSNIPLNSSYANRSTSAYKNELGSAIFRVVKSVPGGVLVFFPSYLSLEESVAYWKETGGLWEAIEGEKRIFVEPKEKSQFASIVRMFCATAEDSIGGAIFLAVCRGKASEGIDFGDNKARAVIITGIPYPSYKDPKVELKKRFLDDSKRSLSGMDWYNQLASRAVNQAIGRVIRHCDDYGAILLFDEKFSTAKNISYLPLWLRSRAQIFSKFKELTAELEMFYLTNQQKKYSGHILNATNQIRREENLVDLCMKRKKINSTTLANEKQPEYSFKFPNYKNSPCQTGCFVSGEESPIAAKLKYPILNEEQNVACDLTESKMKSISNLFSQKKRSMTSLSCCSQEERIAKTYKYLQKAKAILPVGEFSAFENIFLTYSQSDCGSLKKIIYELFAFLQESNHLDLFVEFEMFINEANYSYFCSLKQQQPSSSGKCPVCNKSSLIDPMHSDCKHSCCRNCWDQVFKSAFECPVCKSKVRPSHLRKVI